MSFSLLLFSLWRWPRIQRLECPVQRDSRSTQQDREEHAMPERDAQHITVHAKVVAYHQSTNVMARAQHNTHLHHHSLRHICRLASGTANVLTSFYIIFNLTWLNTVIHIYDLFFCCWFFNSTVSYSHVFFVYFSLVCLQLYWEHTIHSNFASLFCTHCAHVSASFLIFKRVKHIVVVLFVIVLILRFLAHTCTTYIHICSLVFLFYFLFCGCCYCCDFLFCFVSCTYQNLFFFLVRRSLNVNKY